LIIVLEYSLLCSGGQGSIEVAIGDHGSLEEANLSFSTLLLLVGSHQLPNKTFSGI
jgi:hypothetical protein